MKTNYQLLLRNPNATRYNLNAFAQERFPSFCRLCRARARIRPARSGSGPVLRVAVHCSQLFLCLSLSVKDFTEGSQVNMRK